MMKQIKHTTWLILMLHSSALLAQWDFELVDNGQTTQSLPMSLPMLYSEADCELTFTAVVDGQVENVVISNPLGCGQTHYLVIDDHYYLLPDNFSLSIQVDRYDFTGFVNLGECERESGLPISSGLPGLMINEETFQFLNSNDQLIYTREGNTYIQLSTADGDIQCASGLPFLHPDILIFRSAFE